MGIIVFQKTTNSRLRTHQLVTGPNYTLQVIIRTQLKSIFPLIIYTDDFCDLLKSGKIVVEEKVRENNRGRE